MNRKNEKGFMMSEVIVVTAIVIIVLGTMYVSFNKLLSSYRTRNNYYDSVSLYLLVYYRDILIENNLINDLLEKLKKPDRNIINVYNSNYIGDNTLENENLFRLSSSDGNYKYNDVVLMVYNNQNPIDDNVLDNLDNNSDIHQTFKDYVSFLHSSTSLDSNYVMIMERCEKGNIDKCKYGYLEVFDGYEVDNG